MLVAAGVLMLFVVIGPPAGALVDVPASLSSIVLLLAGAAACWWTSPQRLGATGAWLVVPLGAVLVILMLNLVTADTSAAAQVFLCFPILWAASQLRGAAASLVCLVAVLGNAVVVLGLDPPATAVPDIVFVGVVLVAMTGLLTRAADRQEALVTALQQQAARDPLTGLVTRRVLDDAATRALTAVSDKAGTALVLVDVDGFKAVNDEHGHPVGDDALVHLSALLSAQVRATDAVIGRLGGDELAVLMPGCSAEVARVRAEGFVTAVRAHPLHLADGRLLSLSVSIGVAHARPLTADLQALYVAADAALYAAKRGGRDQVAVAAP
ncbi:diguanylate cyclase [Modestobacter sp. I12A-02628]|uniref:GGDEF domain-containing protein n=2 Tax=Goekera deserti TaxID=2497753 RepID=A0A7K3WFA2_9ACTN|nr:diguanylate cyclase [Goekera deserti]NDI48507.1 diguanylate cyclase [Goekera deserti]NEL55114.1 GGDEF domain-containing protein [Goekera deserti]